MSQDNTANANANAANGAVEPNPKEAMFFYHILTSNKTKLEVSLPIIRCLSFIQ
jgi:hypothetical protein